MKVDKIRNLTDVELGNQERELADQLFKLKFQLNMGQTESLSARPRRRKNNGRNDSNGEGAGPPQGSGGGSGRQPHAEDDCGEGDAQEGASVLRTRGGAQQKVL